MFGAMTFGSVALITLLSSVNPDSAHLRRLGDRRVRPGARDRRGGPSALDREGTPGPRSRSRLLEAGAPRVTALFLATLTFSAALTVVVGAVTLGVVLLLLSGPVSRPTLFLPVAVCVAAYVFIGNTSENLDVVSTSFRAGRQLFWVRFVDAASFILIAVPLGARQRGRCGGSSWP